MSKKSAPSSQPCLFDPPSKFIRAYRVSLVRDRSVPFEQCRLLNSQQAQPIIRKLIEAHGQSDWEQFCVILLNSKNEVIGLKIVATGTISSAQVSPREVFKPVILANAAAVIGIQIHEHLIVSMTDHQYYSFSDNGIIRNICQTIG